MTEKRQMRYEGKAKKVYSTDLDGLYIVDYKDDATAFNGEKRGTIVGKGIINNRMSNRLFARLEREGIPTHFVRELSDRETLVHAVTIIPLETVVRNRVAGSMAKRLGLTEGTALARTIVEFYYKDDALGDPLITDDHALVLGFATADEIAWLKATALKVNDVLGAFFRECGVELVDFKLEFGRDVNGDLRLADEISPDTCRFWDIETGEKLDKDRFRRDLGGVEDAYHEIMQRVLEVEV